MEFFKRLVVTVALLAAYKAGFHLSIVPKDIVTDGLIGSNPYSLFRIGITALFSGYFLTEIAFILIPKLRAIRNNGFAGRKVINNWALAVSFLSATSQAIFMVNMLSKTRSFNSPLTFIEPSLLQQIGHILFFLAGLAIILLIGRLISKYGLVNGFCLIVVSEIITQTYGNVADYINTVKYNNVNINFIGFAVFGFICAYIVHLMEKKDWVIAIKNERITSVKVPFFLQGLVVLSLGYTWISLISLFTNTYLQIDLNHPVHAMLNLVTYTALVIVISFVAYWMFSTKKRIASNLNIDEQSVEMDNRPIIMSVITLSLLSIVFMMPMPFEKDSLIPISIYLINLCFIIAIALDVKNQSLFTLKNPSQVEVCDLDNVHMTSVLKDKLETAGIPHCIQAYHFRRMHYFFEPFIKMKLFVSADKKDQAIEILNSIGAKNI